jgi:Protein of unknown function (DUF1552)
MIRRQVISRRAVLQGLGASIALPYLDAMAPKGRAAESAQPPVRLAFLYVPNGMHMPDWTPSQIGANFELPAIPRVLSDLKDDLLVLSGLTLDQARAHGDGGGDHARAMASFLTCRHPRKTEGADLRAGVSVDQIAAQAIGHTTRFPSLQLGCEGGKNAGECDHGYSCAYQSNLSWRNETTPLPNQVNPRLVFDRLIGRPSGTAKDEDQARAERRRRSILDYVSDDASRLGATLGASDRRKMDEYLTSVREIEVRIGRDQPTIGSGRAAVSRPLGIPADAQEHLRLMGDLLALAFATDQTRVATLVFANDGSNRAYPAIGVSDGHHDLSHHGGDAAKLQKIRKINQFHVEQFAYLLRKLKATPEGDGTLLDHCAVLYGSGISDGNSHVHDDLPILLAGRARGAFQTGRHLRFPKETPVANLYVTLLDCVGASAQSFGDSTGRLASLAG